MPQISHSTQSSLSEINMVPFIDIVLVLLIIFMITAPILQSGIDNMEIYRAGNRMFMIIEAGDSYSPAAKAQADAANPDVQRWTARMKQFQQPVPAAGPDGTWIEMERVFRLTDHADR